MGGIKLTEKELKLLSKKESLERLLVKKGVDEKTIRKAIMKAEYEQQLNALQIELVQLQRDIQLKKRRVMLIFEGRDTAGKGGTIKRFIEHLNPRSFRIAALQKPTELEKGQWYFQRYIKHLPNPGEIVFFDRSWYNRAVVEPVMGFCSKLQYAKFMDSVPLFEKMLVNDGIEIYKFWLNIEKEEQAKRFEARKSDPKKRWKISPVDEMAQWRWDLYTEFIKKMHEKTHTEYSPWLIVNSNDKRKARLETMRWVLFHTKYKGKRKVGTHLETDDKIINFYKKK